MNILLTGGTGGLGQAILKALAGDGHKLFFTYAKSEQKAQELCQLYPGSEALQCNFKDAASVGHFLDKISGMNLDVLINNALSGFQQSHFHKIAPDTFLSSFEENVLPVVLITQKALETFRTKKAGKIITVLSESVIGRPPSGYSEYAAGKAYLLSMAKSWASEYIRYGITSNAISPNFMQTELNASLDERVVQALIEAHPLKRLLTPGETAESVRFLVNAPAHINGINLVVNAGINMA